MNYLSNKDIKKIKFKKIGNNVLISKNASILKPNEIEIGDNSRIDDFCLLYGSITIGRNVHITPMCLIGAGKTTIEIKDFSTLAYGVKIFSQSKDYTDGSMANSTINQEFKKIKKGKIIIEKHVIIGANSIVFPGCIIREGTSIGAMSLVNKNTKCWSFYLGIPAIYKQKRKKISERIVNRIIKLQK
jgi:acetyltransferase-like isoleucine patch superfamily enzyme